MISNRCARKSLVTNCNSIISKNYLRFLVDSNVTLFILRLITLLANIDRSIINKMVFYRMDVRYEFQYFGNVFIM